MYKIHHTPHRGCSVTFSKILKWRFHKNFQLIWRHFRSWCSWPSKKKEKKIEKEKKCQKKRKIKSLILIKNQYEGKNSSHQQDKKRIKNCRVIGWCLWRKNILKVVEANIFGICKSVFTLKILFINVWTFIWSFTLPWKGEEP